MINYGRRIGLHEKPAYGTVITDPFHPLSQGLVGYWLMNEGGGNTAYDISGHGNHGTLTNGPTWGGSKFGGGLNFGGSDDYVVTSAPLTTRNFSVIGWVRLGAPTATKGSIYSALEGTSYKYFLTELEGANQKIYIYIGNGSSYQTFTSDVISFDYGWHQVCITVDSSGNITFYYDSIMSGTGSATYSETAFTFQISSDDYRPLDGSTDHVRSYTRALAAWEIEALYHDPFADLLRVPIRRYSVAAAAGLPIPVAMHHYRQRRRS